LYGFFALVAQSASIMASRSAKMIIAGVAAVLLPALLAVLQ
jgi:hypothetical protein